MTAGVPRNARLVDPAAREVAEDLARRSGLSLNEWLVRMMADGPEDVASHDYFTAAPNPYMEAPRPEPAAGPTAPARIETANHPADEVTRVAQALERLSDRIESAEGRQALAISGVERSVRDVIGRLDGGEREQIAVAARFEGALQEVKADQTHVAERLRRMEAEAHGPRSAEALRALEGALGKVAGHLYEGERHQREAILDVRTRIDRIESAAVPEPAALTESVFDRIAARLDEAEQRTSAALRELQSSFSALDGRITQVETTSAESVDQRLEHLASNLSQRVDEARQEMAERLRATADSRFDRVDQALAQMTEHVRTAEQRSAGAIERMGREVLDVAQALNRRVHSVENRSGDAVEQVGAEMARIATAVEGRLTRADTVQAQALEKLGGEIARITERLAERIANAERRSAQAIDDVGEQMARVTERISERHERSTTELADRIRLSEERTARLLEEARLKIDERLGEAQRRITEAQARPAVNPSFADAEDGLFENESFPAYQPAAAAQPFAAPQAFAPRAPAAERFATTPRPAQADEHAFDDADFDAASDFTPVATASAAPAALARVPAASPFAAGADDHELEPNVGFEADDDFLKPTALAATPKILDQDFEPADDLLAPEPAAPAPMAPATAAPLTTREVIERARAAARAASEKDARAAKPTPEKPQRDGGVLSGLAFGRGKRRGGSAIHSALLVSGVLASISLAGGGLLVLEAKPGGKLPARIAEALNIERNSGEVKGAEPDTTPGGRADAAPMAAMALSPKPVVPSPDLTAAYDTAVAKLVAKQAGGLDSLRRVANLGYAPAQFYLGKLYEAGQDGLKKDPAQAREWTERAAEGGDRKAMHNLALYYFVGTGGPRNSTTAAEWFRRAADLGLVDSQYNLGRLYEEGLGVSQNPAEAYKWYLIAAAAGDQESRAGAARARADLTPDARAAAERSAAAFRPAAPNPSASPAAAAAAAAPSADLVTAQKALSQLGYYQGPTDGAASPALHMAIAAYQRDQGLPTTGAPDTVTIGKLAVYTR